MNISIKDYNLQNIILVHNFIAIFLIFVLIFVLIYFWNILKIFTYYTEFLRFANACTQKINKSKWFYFTKGVQHRKLAENGIQRHTTKSVFMFIWTRPFAHYLKILHNIKLEVVWTILPIIIILEMIFPSLSLVADEEIDNKGSLYTVGVIGNQWYWNYELNLVLGVIKYVSNLVILEDDNRDHFELTRLLVTTKSLPLAVGTKASFYITSNDVAHSWSVPGLGIKVDAIPGRINLKTVITSRIGLYNGMCSELCGIEHGFMPISLQVVTFSKWWYNIKDSLESLNSKNIIYLNDIWYLNNK